METHKPVLSLRIERCFEFIRILQVFPVLQDYGKECRRCIFAKLSKAPAGWVLALFSNNPAAGRPAIRPAVRPSVRNSSNLTLQEAEIQYASSIWLNEKKYAN